MSNLKFWGFIFLFLFITFGLGFLSFNSAVNVKNFGDYNTYAVSVTILITQLIGTAALPGQNDVTQFILFSYRVKKCMLYTYDKHINLMFNLQAFRDADTLYPGKPY